MSQWLTTELTYLRHNYGKVPVRDMSPLLERHTVRGIVRKAQWLGLRSALFQHSPGPGTLWTPENYPRRHAQA